MRSTGRSGDHRPRPSTPRSCPAFCSQGWVRVAQGWARRGDQAGPLAVPLDDMVRRSPASGSPGKTTSRSPWNAMPGAWPP